VFGARDLHLVAIQRSIEVTAFGQHPTNAAFARLVALVDEALAGCRLESGQGTLRHTIRLRGTVNAQCEFAHQRRFAGIHLHVYIGAAAGLFGAHFDLGVVIAQWHQRASRFVFRSAQQKRQACVADLLALRFVEAGDRQRRANLLDQAVADTVKVDIPESRSGVGFLILCGGGGQQQHEREASEKARQHILRYRTGNAAAHRVRSYRMRQRILLQERTLCAAGNMRSSHPAHDTGCH